MLRPLRIRRLVSLPNQPSTKVDVVDAYVFNGAISTKTSCVKRPQPVDYGARGVSFERGISSVLSGIYITSVKNEQLSIDDYNPGPNLEPARLQLPAYSFSVGNQIRFPIE